MGLKAAESRGSSTSPENSYKRMLVELFKKKSLRSFAELVRKLTSLCRSHVREGNGRVMLVKSGSINEDYCSICYHSSLAVNEIEILGFRIVYCMSKIGS